MPTSTKTARQFHSQQTHYLRRTITFANNGQAVEVGIVPAGAVILKPSSGVVVCTAFNAATTNVVDIGTAADDDFFGTDLALGTVNFVALDENVSGRVAADTLITATVTLTGGTPSAGEAEVIISYVPDNDG